MREVQRWVVLCAVTVGVVCVVLGPRLGEANTDQSRTDMEVPLDDAQCVDQIQGLWLGQTRYNGDWYRLSVRIKRAEGQGKGALVGTIRSRFWKSAVEFRTPTACENVERDVTVLMNARGEESAERGVALYGVDWVLEEAHCGRAGFSSYIPDGFFGELSREEPNVWNATWLGIRRTDLVEHVGSYRGEGARGQGENYVVVDEVTFRRVQCVQRAQAPVPALPSLPETDEEPPEAPCSAGCGGCTR